MPTLHLEVHYEVDLASDATVLAELCTALVDLHFGSSARVGGVRRRPRSGRRTTGRSRDRPPGDHRERVPARPALPRA